MRREKTMDTLIRSIMIKSKRKMDAKVAQFGLTTQQARVLGFLNDNAANEIIQKDLQRIFQTRGASITSLISRKPSLRDGREKVVTLTEEGLMIIPNKKFNYIVRILTNFKGEIK
ncbi:Transcriptional activatory protein BadR [Listeria monocytogenes]|nr:Transcriptional activatory protein BadR [Listeria monocytogenes]